MLFSNQKWHLQMHAHLYSCLLVTLLVWQRLLWLTEQQRSCLGCLSLLLQPELLESLHFHANNCLLDLVLIDQLRYLTGTRLLTPADRAQAATVQRFVVEDYAYSGRMT